MSLESQVEGLLFEAIEELNTQLPEGQKVEKNKDALLFGTNSALDSFGLVNLLVIAEQKVQEDLDAIITIADERAMSQKNSPFRSVEALAGYIIMLIKEQS